MQTWLITGSSRGFGRALTEEVLAAGDTVLATARKAETLNFLDKIEEPARVRRFALDVTDAKAAGAAVQTAIHEFGGLDVVVNNAGYAVANPIEFTPMDDFRAQFETNYFGMINVTQAALRHFRTQRSGHFLQFSSIGGRVGGTPGLAAYQSSKFAVEGFSEVLSAEVGPLGIHVTIVEPGAFRTEWGSASMRTEPVDPDYESTVGEANRSRESTVENWAGDPVRAARIMIDVVRSERPPLRLLLGAGAVASAQRSSRVRAAEVDAWADISRSADLPETPE